jgi:hypothetical protein
MNGEVKNAHIIKAGKPEGERLLEKCRPKWQDNIEMALKV